MSNIRDVAKLSGHSVSTVSRVINNQSYVATETKEEILKAMKELNYHPNDIARALSTGKTYRVGVVMPYSNHPYFQKLVSAITQAAFKENYQVTLLPSHYNVKSEIKYLEMLKHQAFDGLIFTSRAIPFETIVDYQKYGSITCCEDTLDYPISCAYTDREKSYIDAFELLKKLKFQNIGVTVSRNEQTSRSAKSTVDSYYKVFGEKCPEKLLVRNMQFFKDGIQAAKELTAKNSKLDAVFANGDQVAAGIIYQLKKMQIDVPVIGQENLDYSYLMNFSTIDHKLNEIGEYAFWSLFEKKIVKKLIPAEFILRGALI
ncbi:LacI family DNA-binding transcriptional regulator [Companilactobacillus kimchii]|uniref:Catabolite control protein B n=2 Tax=Companilactobacillus kimchii TaxID=2801452 RepID=A0ABR5NUG3_9LACO|nr:LacI family DNA-binding transcriptional regulator [Companilactobacillus kimchii]KAE9559763.1 hypothetical protein ATN91_09685 [Companilactobacillus kimchii]KRK52296.1 catabolite control protein B [Companilactobacillus kimchii DSM 13961 = JCM 10707]OWF31881.1 Catabolite control protein [Companilactobacillus kimchii]GEO48573.1 LacI family transcriptional regulator [Companilactobacillus paralimentarius]